MIIYKITNKLTNKSYVGKSLHDDNNYYGSGKIIQRAIKKYGKINFIREVIEYIDNIDLLNERETYWINKLNTLVPFGYNIATGGDGGDTLKFHPNRKSILNTIKEKRALQKMLPCSDETKKKIRESQVGKKRNPLSAEHKEKLRIANTGKKMPLRSLEYRKKSSIAHKNQIPWNKGLKDIYSSETIEKMRMAAKNKPKIDEETRLKFKEKRPSREKKFTDSEKTMIHEFLEAKMSIRKISKKLNTSPQTIKKYLQLNKELLCQKK